MYKNLRHFLKALDSKKELKYIDKEVSAHIEISIFTDKESKSHGGGKALFFKNVKGSKFPVVTNIFGSQKRICMALGVKHLDHIGERIQEFIEFNPPKNLRSALHIIPMAISTSNFFPRYLKSQRASCQEVVLKGDDVDLSLLPVLHCWPKDAGPFITLPMVITKSPVTGKRNVGMYRMQIFDKNTTGMHWHIHKDGSHYYNEFCRMGKRMPVAVAIGADPATIFAATAPLPRGVDEMILAGFIRRKPVMMVRCVTVDLEVPAEAEFILEGYVEPGELRTEGPFGDHTGYYSLADEYPVFHVTALTHRKNPVYNATLVGRPPMEDCYMAKATERIFLPMLQAVMPEICDYWFPWEGVFHNIVIVSIDKEYQGHALKIINGLWGQGQMSFCKAIVVVDKDTAPHNTEKIIKKFLTGFDITSDIILAKGVLDVLDHSSPYPNFGTKIGIDLTHRFKNEPPERKKRILIPASDTDELLNVLNTSLPSPVKSRYLFKEVSEKENTPNRILAVCVQKEKNFAGKDLSEIIFNISELELFNIIILFDIKIDLNDNSLILWKLFNNVDPGRDMFFNKDRLVIDACKKGELDGHKREWPDELLFDIS